MKRKANAIWKGSGKEGNGILNGPSGVLKATPFSFKARFENESGEAGTNPEELIAAAHAGCYSMQLSFMLNANDFTADTLDVDVIIEMEEKDGGFAFKHIQLNLDAKVPDISEDEFKSIANKAKDFCPVSKALSSVPLDLKITFSN
jgi:osmotically inducible protein OsmC